MRSILTVGLVVTLAASGCLVVADEPPVARDMVAKVEPSMLPNFGKESGPYYRMVMIHQHVFPSPEQEREANRPGQARVVCFRLDDLSPAPMMDSAAPAAMNADIEMCAPSVDTGRGRLYADPKAFRELEPLGVAVTGDCNGHYLPIKADEPGLVAQAPGHAFRIEFLANDTLLVAGRWYVPPGHALKIDYVAAGPKAGSDDDQPVKFVVDYAGFWLHENVVPFDPDGGGVGPTRREGNGPVAWVPRMPTSVADIIEPLRTAYPGADRVLHFQATALQGNLTDLRVELGGVDTIRWFVGGANQTHVRMLGAVEPATPAGGVPLQRFIDSFTQVPLADLLDADQGRTMEMLWQPRLGLKSRMPVEWSETWLPALGRCDEGCAWVWASAPTQAASWRAVPDPGFVDDVDALTLTFTEGHGAQTVLRAVYHRP